MSDPLAKHGDLRYSLLEQEADKRKQRRQLEILMAEFLASGGWIKRIEVKGSEKPKWKFLNRKQRVK